MRNIEHDAPSSSTPNMNPKDIYCLTCPPSPTDIAFIGPDKSKPHWLRNGTPGERRKKGIIPGVPGRFKVRRK